ncbi:iron-containing alcohol dehydrogenase [Thermodesulfobacteriota bacterium]
MQFEFATAGRIVFGPGSAAKLKDSLSGLGSRGLVITGKSARHAETVLEQLDAAGIAGHTCSVAGEPTIETVTETARIARDAGCDLVIGVGGGSVIDTAKAVAALLTNPGELMDYLEVIGRGRPIARSPAACIALPTTAGTGAEVARNAVITAEQQRVKVSMRSPLMLPRLAIVDPELTLSLPPDITASTGLDALTQLLEALVSKKATPLTDGICREGLRRAAFSLPRACEDGSDLSARTDMSLASLFGGLALANAGLGAVHGFAGPLGGMYRAPHGMLCARLLPFVMATNVAALQARAPDNPGLVRFDEIARILTGNPAASAPDGVAWIRDLCGALTVPALAQFGVSPDDFDTIVEKAGKASSMKGNPLELTRKELAAILEKAL